MTQPDFQLPANFQAILDDAIRRFSDGLAPPEAISEVYEWLEDGGLDELLKVSEDLIGISIDEISTEQFNDINLRDWLGVPTSQKINDDQRIEFIIERISEGGVGALGEYDFPSILKFPIVSQEGRTALIGGYALMCGQGGPEFTWLGIFADETQFYERLKVEGIRLPSELLNLPATELLTWWRKGQR
jgi:hypothetical protein